MAFRIFLFCAAIPLNGLFSRHSVIFPPVFVLWSVLLHHCKILVVVFFSIFFVSLVSGHFFGFLCFSQKIGFVSHFAFSRHVAYPSLVFYTCILKEYKLAQCKIGPTLLSNSCVVYNLNTKTLTHMLNI